MSGPATSANVHIHPAHDWETEIVQRLGRRIRKLKVEVRDEGVVLSGEAPSFYTKQLVQQAAMELGAAVLANDIEVRSPPLASGRSR